MNQLNEDSTNEIIDNPTFNFKSRIGYQLGLGAEYPIFRRTKFFIKTSYRHSPKLTGIGKEQFYQSCSLGAGVRILIE